MKKILIATSALVAISAPALALDVKTSGAVEYRYNKATEKNVAKNAKLSQQDAHIKFAASGASNGLAYGAWIKTKSGTATTYSTKASGTDIYAGTESNADDKKTNQREILDFFAQMNTGYTSSNYLTKVRDDFVSGKIAPEVNIATTDFLGQWHQIGVNQSGQAVWAHVELENKHSAAADKGDVLTHASSGAAGKAVIVVNGFAVGEKPTIASGVTKTASTAHTSSTDGTTINKANGASIKAGTSQTLANNASTQSAMWVNGAFGGLVIGQDGDATGLAPSGSVSAASFNGGKQLAYFTAGNKGERVTYTAPTFVEGLKVSYTHNFKGNVSADKSAKVKAPTSYGVQYATDFAGVMFKVGYAQADLGKQGSAKAIKNTKTGVELGYGGFTVGYGTFTVGKKAFQKKDTTGTNYGVKYASGAWAVGYTVNKSEDKNKYITHSNKTANTNAISASYKVADGFNVYASKSSNSVKNTNGKTEKNSYTIIGAKISF